MNIFDISMKIHPDMAVFKNKEVKKPTIAITRDFVDGAGARESKLSLELHTGTHMDAPLHMIEGGQNSSYFQLKDMVTHCKVFDLTQVDSCITADDLRSKDIQQGDYILLKTKNSFEDCFNLSFIYLERSAAQLLVQIGIKGVGIDSLGIERSQEDYGTHKALLGNGIYILEGLRLKNIQEGSYILIAAPLNISDVEASPVRALLLEEGDIAAR